MVELFHTEGRSLVRLARLFVDDRDAAEDIVQEAFLRLARHAGRIESADRAPAYLRSIVLNLARDHNRRGLMSLRHHAASRRELDVDDDVAEVLARSDEHRRVVEAVRGLPRRQRDCVTLRYFEQLRSTTVASTLGVSPNSVKTHLRRALDALGGDPRPTDDGSTMSDATIERRLQEAFDDVRASVVEHPDLFARVQRTIEDARLRRRFRARLGLAIAGFLLANAALAVALSDRHEGSITMPWWVIELITNIVLVALAIALGPVHQALRTGLCRRCVPVQPAHRQELPRPHRRRLLLDLHGVHPLHDHVRGAVGLVRRRQPAQARGRHASAGSC